MKTLRRRTSPPQSMPTPTFRRVVDEARTGVTAQVVAARLGIPEDLAEAMIDELRAAGVAAPLPSARGCGTCPPPEAAPLACSGCPLAR